MGGLAYILAVTMIKPRNARNISAWVMIAYPE